MDSNLKLILEEFEVLKDQFVITQSHRIERLIAIGSDEMDYYWVTYDGRKLTWNTCVGGLVPLKGYLREKDYSNLIRSAKLNHGDQTSLWFKKENETSAEARKNHKDKLTLFKGEDKFLTDICWDLN